MVEAGARIVRSRIVGPAIIGAGTVVEDSHIGPYTSIGQRLRASTDSEIEYSIVLDGASSHRRARARGSLIGRDADVRSRPTVPARGHRLVVVDDHSRVEVAA